MKNRYKISITVERRILLHLASYIEFKNKFEVINDVTQSGIAKAIGMRLEHVSRSVKKLESEDLIFVRSANIKETDRRKKAYFLTKKGFSFTNDLKNKFNEILILIRTLDNELREIKFSELPRYVDIDINPLDIYKYSMKSGDRIIDLKQIISDKSNKNYKKHQN